LKRIVLPLLTIILATLACGKSTPTPAAVDRYSLLPEIKYTPEMDSWPPIIIDGWAPPVPLPYPVNTSGGEDSPFIMPDGQILYFFFTPDVSIPPERQLLDGVTGIWVVHRDGETWTEPERVRLSDPGELSLDGCEFVLGNRMYFCSTREGYTGVQWFSAEFQNGIWQAWRYAADELKQNEFEVGELHITADGQELFFHSSRPGGYGGLDIWVSQKNAGSWGEPVNLGPNVNTSTDEGWPFVSVDGQELWFNGQSTRGHPGPAIFRSLRQTDGSWGVAAEIVSQFAGEPTLCDDGKTLYFVHHYYSKDLNQMQEADIYVTHQLEP
jgi:hypothetical protein